jgi:hypothetical protein
VGAWAGLFGPRFVFWAALMPRYKFAGAILTNLEELPDRNDFAADIARVVLRF